MTKTKPAGSTTSQAGLHLFLAKDIQVMKILKHSASEYNHKHHWRPGDPIPCRGSGIEPNAWHALVRNAEAYERWQQEEQRKRVADRRAA